MLDSCYEAEVFGKSFYCVLKQTIFGDIHLPRSCFLAIEQQVLEPRRMVLLFFGFPIDYPYGMDSKAIDNSFYGMGQESPKQY